MSTLDQGTLNTLTPEEQEALREDEAAEQEAKAAAKADDQDDDEDKDDQDDAPAGALPVEGKGAADTPADKKTNPPADKAPPDEDDSSAQAKADDAADDADTPPARRDRFYQADMPEDYQATIDGLKARDAELRQKFKDGEIDIDERDEQLSAIAQEREDLLVKRTKAEVSREISEQTEVNQWKATVRDFMASTAKAGAVDYTKDEAKQADLDLYVKSLANRPENADKPMGWFLSEAHNRVMALHGLTPAPAPAPAPAPKTAAQVAAERRTPLDKAPRTLADVPGSDGPGDVDGEFADILALEGQAYEDAIERMTPAVRERFARVA